MTMKVVDLFAGCGGFSVGFTKAGNEIIKAVEFDASIAETYKRNHPNTQVIVDDIKNVDETNVFKRGECDVIVGGPPCQGFSMAGARIRSGFIDDPRNYLFKHYFNVVKKIHPKAFVIENVKGIMTMQNGEIFKEIIRLFSDKTNFNGVSYNVFTKVLKAVEFGIPQKRERVVIIGYRGKKANVDEIWEKTREEILSVNPTYFDEVTVEDAIGNLPAVTDDGEIKRPKPQTAYQKYLAGTDGSIKNHAKTNHSSVAEKRMKKVAQGENFTALKENIKSVHSGSYGRLEWNKPSQTVTTRFDTPAGGRFTHPTENRTITPREAARLQSFPDDFVFYGNRTSICKQIGNAVPPKISFSLAKFIANILEG